MTAYYHLPGLFEFYGLYRVFLPLYHCHREYFYDWCEIGSIYGAPADCLWGGGRVGFGDNRPEDVAELMRDHGISARGPSISPTDAAMRCAPCLKAAGLSGTV